MGGIHRGLFLRGVDQGAVAEALAAALAPAGWAPAAEAPPYDFVSVDVTGERYRRFFLGPALDGWVGLYDQDHPGAEQLSAALGGALACPACYLWSHHGDFWGYVAFRGGEPLDAFSSCLSPVPDFATAPLEDAARLWGRPAALAPLLSDARRSDAIEACLRESIYPPALLGGRRTLVREPVLGLDPPTVAARIRAWEGTVVVQEEGAADLLVMRTREGADFGTQPVRLDPTVLSRLLRDPALGPPPGDVAPFARLLGLPNAETSYEYLARGLWEGIQGREGFRHLCFRHCRSEDGEG
jgi:hypothetical protein